MSSLILLFAASLISPSLEINSVYTTSAPFSLQRALNGGRLRPPWGLKVKGSFRSLCLQFLPLSFFVVD